MIKMSSLPSQSKNATPTLANTTSCLRNKSNSKAFGGRTCPPNKVTFPDEECNLVTGYMEPANPWEYAECDGPDELVALYKESCVKHGTEPLPSVVLQIQAMDLSLPRNESFVLNGVPLLPIQLEPLEEILKRVQFKRVEMEGAGLNDESSVALFDMLEYYESTSYLNISSNQDIGGRGWHACSRMIKKTECLERLDAKNMTLNEQHMPILARALRISTQLQILKLENCWLSGRPMIILAAALRLNTGLKELHLADNDLAITDAIQLAGLLRANTTLQLLDVSNNNLQDVGIGHISDGLIDQVPTAQGGGLGILVLWNNHLTRNCSKHFSRALALSRTLGMLNIGHNVLTNECLHTIKDALQQNRTLLRLGMQSTHLTGEGAIALAECVADHPVIQRIDLRDNNLEVAGLMALTLAMKVNSSVTQLDLDDVPKKKLENGCEAEQYRLLLAEIRGYCTRNEQAPQEDLDLVAEEQPEQCRVRLKSITSRKISLTCETLSRAAQPAASNQFLTEPKRAGGRLRSPAPSPIPSPVSSPLPSPSRTRFSVVKVTESPSTSPCTTFFPSPSNSRFHVSRVEDTSASIVTSPSGKNLTLGFTFDVKTVSTVTDTTSISKPCLPDICVTVSHGTVTEDKTDAEVRHIMDCSDGLQLDSVSEDGSSEFRTSDWKQGNNSYVDSIRSSESKTGDDIHETGGEGVIEDAVGVDTGDVSRDDWGRVVEESASRVEEMRRVDDGARSVEDGPSVIKNAQRTRKISCIAPAPQIDERIPTSLEKLIGLFNPGLFFNKPSNQCRSVPMSEERGLPDTINNNTSDSGTANVISLDVTIDQSCCTTGDENFNMGQSGKHSCQLAAGIDSDGSLVTKQSAASDGCSLYVQTDIPPKVDIP